MAPLPPEAANKPVIPPKRMAESNGESRQTPPPPQNGEGEPTDLISVMNTLQNKLSASGHSLDVDLPQIVVVGCQSAGKSSVLENFVGKEFLPRGVGTVTRRPTVVQMFQTDGEEYGVFLHRKDQRFTDFEEIKAEIVAETMRNPGPKGFSSVPINLEIYTRKALKLTVVDLPGLKRNRDMDEPETTISELREMVLSYIRSPETIILAVSPANHDLDNSEALAIARIADPLMARTIGVLTKLDIMDTGTDAREILENLKHPLQRGYVGVLNRSQQDIADKRDINYILKREKEFFETKSCYRHLASRMGTPYLQKTLQKSLRAHIQKFLPKLRSSIQQKLCSYQRELDVLRTKMGDDTHGKQKYMSRQVQEFVQDIRTKLLGNSELVSMDEVTVGARIHYTLHTQVQRYLDLDLVPDERELRIAIVNQSAIRTSISVPGNVLEAMCRKLMQQFKYPMEKSVNCVKELLLEAVTESAKLLDSYQTTKNELIYMIGCVLEKEATRTEDRLKEHIDAEMFYVNLEHPDFNAALCDPVAPTAGPIKMWESPEENGDASNAVPQELNNNSTHLEMILQSNAATQAKVQYVTALMMKYLEIVKKQVHDMAVKYIVFFLVKKVYDFIENELVFSIRESPNLHSLTADCEDDFRRKDEMDAACNVMKGALDAIQNF